jgi:MOSC domain-containing protein YiiM
MANSDLEMKIVSIAISKKKGTPKVQVGKASLLEDHGLEGDAHAGPWHRQVSFLAAESIEKARKKGLDVDFGAFAENIATSGIDWQDIPVGARVMQEMWNTEIPDEDKIKSIAAVHGSEKM